MDKNKLNIMFLNRLNKNTSKTGVDKFILGVGAAFRGCDLHIYIPHPWADNGITRMRKNKHEPQTRKNLTRTRTEPQPIQTRMTRDTHDTQRHTKTQGSARIPTRMTRRQISDTHDTNRVTRRRILTRTGTNRKASNMRPARTDTNRHAASLNSAGLDLILSGALGTFF